MPRKITPRTRCSGLWTEAQFVTFIKNQLRGATRKWRPIQDALRKARVSKGMYRCAGWDNQPPHVVPVTVVKNKRRVKNVSVDHNPPIVDPTIGFSTWDDFINRLFCEEEDLQVLCSSCHDAKSKDERDIATERRRQERDY